jgi:hypothetical protein
LVILSEVFKHFRILVTTLSMLLLIINRFLSSKFFIKPCHPVVSTNFWFKRCWELHNKIFTCLLSIFYLFKSLNQGWERTSSTSLLLPSLLAGPRTNIFEMKSFPYFETSTFSLNLSYPSWINLNISFCVLL